MVLWIKYTLLREWYEPLTVCRCALACSKTGSSPPPRMLQRQGVEAGAGSRVCEVANLLRWLNLWTVQVAETLREGFQYRPPRSVCACSAQAASPVWRALCLERCWVGARRTACVRRFRGCVTAPQSSGYGAVELMAASCNCVFGECVSVCV